jgi:sugar/nucleoside kinase (ribokinase family)
MSWLGDCFRGSFAAMLAKGEPIEACLKFAAASSALCVGMLGATMPSFNATMAFLSARHSSM